jgi:hypothetical protein
MNERLLMRIGAVSAVVGSIIFAVSNILHPRSENVDDYSAQLALIARSDIWVTDHLLLILGIILMLAGLVAVGRSIVINPGATWAHLGRIGAIVSTSLAVVLVGIDGPATKAVATAWLDAPASEQATALRIAETLEEIDADLFSIYVIAFLGLTLLLYGLAIAFSNVYPRWLGWFAVVIAVPSFVVGLVQVYQGLSFVVSAVLIPVLFSLFTLWLLITGVLLWRGAAARVPGASQGATSDVAVYRQAGVESLIGDPS